MNVKEEKNSKKENQDRITSVPKMVCHQVDTFEDNLNFNNRIHIL